MPGVNRYHPGGPIAKSSTAGGVCVFISHRLADLDVAKAVGKYLTDEVGVDIYLSDSDVALQVAVMLHNDEKIVEYIENGIISSTHLLGILSKQTRGSWWVPFEFGAGRQRRMTVAQLLLEDVQELPSYLKITTILRDSDDLSKWAKGLSIGVVKGASSVTVPDIPRVATYQSGSLRWS